MQVAVPAIAKIFKSKDLSSWKKITIQKVLVGKPKALIRKQRNEKDRKVIRKYM
jgi:hypothetical protein